MEILYHARFLKKYRKRILPDKRLKRQAKLKFDLFSKDPFHESLSSHCLRGKKIGLRAFSVTGDYRVI